MKVIDLDSIPTYTKLELAVHQLDRAIRLLLDEQDCISAITLAGAAEEILGDLLKRQDGISAHQELINECMQLSRRTQTEPVKASEFHEMFTYYRNELKHLRTGSDISVNAACARPILDRAVENLQHLGAPQSLQALRFIRTRQDG